MLAFPNNLKLFTSGVVGSPVTRIRVSQHLLIPAVYSGSPALAGVSDYLISSVKKLPGTRGGFIAWLTL